jgi:hypothetical protein
MSIRIMLLIAAIVGLFILTHVTGNRHKHPTTAAETATPMTSNPPPAASPTVTPQERPNLSPKRANPESKPGPYNDDKESSSLTAGIRSRLTRIVRLSASWPGSIPKRTLLQKLEDEQPFITSEAIAKIQTEWSHAPQTVKVTIRQVNLEQ